MQDEEKQLTSCAGICEALTNVITHLITPNQETKTISGYFHILPTNTQAIEDEINNLNSYKAPGLDQICAQIFEEVSSQFAPPLSHLFNYIFQSGTCPKKFKITLVKPVHKHIRNTS